jgi:hypothetical protein
VDLKDAPHGGERDGLTLYSLENGAGREGDRIRTGQLGFASIIGALYTMPYPKVSGLSR